MSDSTLTLYTWPKSFADDHIARIQRNAVRSWLRLEPKPRVLVFGDDSGVREYCQEFGLTHVVDDMEIIDGTVRMRDMAVKAESLSDSSFYCFINADIILTSSLMKALPAISSSVPQFLLGGSPWNIDITEDLKFADGWEEKMERGARQKNELRSRTASDFFLYPKGYLSTAPGVVIGRFYVDNGLMWYTRSRGHALIDSTPGILTFHQHHGYRHLGNVADDRGEALGAKVNVAAVGGPGHLYTWQNATHHYTKSGLHTYWTGQLCVWSTHPSGASRPMRFFNQVIWPAMAKASRPLRKVFGLVNPR